MTEARRALTRLSIVLALSSFVGSGCVAKGVDRLASQLVWGTHWMKLLQQTERRVEYEHHTDGRYWIIALPAHTSLFQLGNTGIPQTVVAVVEDCARGAKPILVLIQEQNAECVYPAYPEALNPQIVAKEPGQTTVFTLVRSDAGIRIAKME